MKTKEILQKARDLISKPENWTQQQYAANKSGRTVDENDPAACKWCITGALIKVGDDKVKAWNYLHKFLGIFPANFNDSHTHAEVLATFDAAIASCED